MILFLDDWKKYPEACVHVETRNKSFLDYCSKLRDSGVANYFFPLALHNPDLRWVDPHDPDIKPEVAELVAIEAKNNPWYYLREVIRIPQHGGDGGDSFEAGRGNMALMWLFLNHVDTGITQPRQTGKSIGADSICSWAIYIHGKGTKVSLFTKDEKLRVENVDRLKQIRNLLPPYLQFRHKKDTDNTQEIFCGRFRNRYRTAVSQHDPSNARNVGRGISAQIMLLDEPPYCPYIAEVMEGMLPGGNEARDRAAKLGALYGTIFTTTAGMRNTASGAYMYELLFGGMGWDEALYDLKNNSELHEVVDKNSPGLKPMVYIILSHRQLGKTDEWMVKKIRDNNWKGDAAKRDALNIWTAGDETHPLDGDILDQINRSKKAVKYLEISPAEKYSFRWYIPKDQIARRLATGKFIMGSDSSEGLGKDSTSLVLMDASTLEVIGAANINEFNILKITRWVANLLATYENIILVPERRSGGTSMVDILLVELPLLGIDPFKRIYNQIVDEHKLHEDDYKTIQRTPLERRNDQFYDHFKGYFGYVTSGSGKFSRSNLYNDVFKMAASYGCQGVTDEKLIQEISGLVEKNNRIDHASGKHDDLVIGWLLAVWFLTKTKNLRFYGIENALNNVREYNPEERRSTQVQNPVNGVYDRLQKSYVENITRLLEELKSCKDDVMAMKIENQLRVLDSRLTSRQDRESLSIDKMITDARDARLKSSKDRYRNWSNNRSSFNPYRR